jgi:hypothetical protein
MGKGAAVRYRQHRTISGGAAIAIATFAIGCTTGVYGEVAVEYPVVRAEVVPTDIYYYPRAYYEGRNVYLVDDRWYYPYRNHWVVYQREPVELHRYRVRYYDRYGHGYRPAYRYRPGYGHGRYYRAPLPPRGPYHPYPPYPHPYPR